MSRAVSSSPIFYLSVDLDPLWAYHRIHGLEPPPPRLRHLFTLEALPRFLALFAELEVRGTFFVVGSDLSAEVLARLREAVDLGHEVGNHTASHPYGFLDLGGEALAREIDEAHERLADGLGVAPRGFRSPGYHVSRPVLEHLARRRYVYDSSVLPSWPYYVAKLAVMAWLRLARRPSGARLHPPQALLAPGRPYRPRLDRPWRPGRAPLLELPAASLVAGMPLVGTFLAGLPEPLAERLGRWLVRSSFVGVELHAIDLVGGDGEGIGRLRAHQPGLAVPLERRRRALLGLLQPLGRRVCDLTLLAAARRLGGRETPRGGQET